MEPSDLVCDYLLMKEAINPLSTVIILGIENWGLINLQLMLPVQRLETCVVEHYRGSSVESET